MTYILSKRRYVPSTVPLLRDILLSGPQKNAGTKLEWYVLLFGWCLIDSLSDIEDGL